MQWTMLGYGYRLTMGRTESGKRTAGLVANTRLTVRTKPCQSHMGNFNILMSAEVNSKAKCRILCSDIQLFVLYNFIFRGASECSPKYILV